MFNKVIIVGAGLIGSSIGRGLTVHVNSLHYIDIDRGHYSDVKNADLIILATPVLVMPNILRQIQPLLRQDTIIMDVASTKSWLLAQAQEILSADQFSRFVGSHPIAGKETSGFAAGEATLFQDKPVILTPMPTTAASALAQTKTLWEVLGAKIYEMNPEAHDLAFGKYSHLSNILSFLLQRQDHYEPKLPAELLPPSFKDMTRLAQSSPEMWRDISISNQEAILTSLKTFMDDASRFREILQRGEPQALLHFFQKK